jgi:hypothetical protein
MNKLGGKRQLRTLLLLAALAVCLVAVSACTASSDGPTAEPAESPLNDAEEALARLDAQDAGSSVDDTATPGEESATPADSEDNTVDDGPVEWVTFESDYGFTLQYPSNWVVVDDGERYAILLRPYDGTQTSFYVDTHTKEFADWTEADMVNGMISDVVRIRTSQEDVTFTDPESTEINGYPFMAQNYEVDTEEGIYHGECYYAAKGEIGFEMYYSIQPDEYETLLPTLREIAQSFIFTD